MAEIIKFRGDKLRCCAIHCPTKIEPKKFLCVKHWNFLAPQLKAEISMMFAIQIQADGKSGPHPKWKQALSKAVQWIALKEGTLPVMNPGERV